PGARQRPARSPRTSARAPPPRSGRRSRGRRSRAASAPRCSAGLAAPAALRVETALRDREAQRARRARQVALLLRPEGRAADRLLELAARDVRGRADVE